jgi:hypothetical protein
VVIYELLYYLQSVNDISSNLSCGGVTIVLQEFYKTIPGVFVVVEVLQDCRLNHRSVTLCTIVVKVGVALYQK